MSRDHDYWLLNQYGGLALSNVCQVIKGGNDLRQVRTQALYMQTGILPHQSA